jgi:hypothetical protein
VRALTAKAKLRVAVARDVIKQLKLEKYRAVTGIYCQFGLASRRDPELLYDNPPELKPGVQLQKQFRRIKQCKVCGIGAVFISMVRLRNRFVMSESERDLGEISEASIRDLLLKHFSYIQIGLIETVFEGSEKVIRSLRSAPQFLDILTVYCGESKREQEFNEQVKRIDRISERCAKDVEAALDLYRHYYMDDGERLSAIMRNIVEHGGTFCPMLDPVVTGTEYRAVAREV